MNKPIRIVAVFCMLLFLALMGNVTYLQFFHAHSLDHDPRNARVIQAAYSRERGPILVGRTQIARSRPTDDSYKFQRTYADPELYAPVTGYFSFQHGATGIESSQNDELSGDDPSLFVPKLVDLFTDGNTQGGSVQLTIDPAAQKAAYDGLKALGSDVQGAVVAIEPATGKILAMVSLPTYDPAKLASHDFKAAAAYYQKLNQDPAQPLLNRAIQTRIFPGSVFKVVTASAAYQSGRYRGANAMVPGGDTYDLPDSSNVVHNESDGECGSGMITMTLAMENSCNTSFAPLAVEVGAEGMLKQAEAFGFNSDYLNDLGPQAKSFFPAKLDKPQTALTGFGQYEVQATPLQMAMVAAGIANDGTVMRPYIVDEVASQDLDAQQVSPQKLSQAVSPSTADAVTKLMIATVDQGTATPAQIQGVPVAGKTGTAQSGVSDRSPYAWFISFAPATAAPKVAVAVMIQNADIPRSDIAGGRLGGPIAKAVMQAVLDGHGGDR